MCGAKIPTSKSIIRPNAGKIHARRNEVFLERNFATLGNTIRPTTSAIDALIINDDIIPALPQTYLK